MKIAVPCGFQACTWNNQVGHEFNRGLSPLLLLVLVGIATLNVRKSLLQVPQQWHPYQREARYRSLSLLSLSNHQYRRSGIADYQQAHQPAKSPR